MTFAAVQHHDLGSALIAFAVFLAFYLALRARRARATGRNPPLQWGWLIAIICCAVVAYLLGRS